MWAQNIRQRPLMYLGVQLGSVFFGLENISSDSISENSHISTRCGCFWLVTVYKYSLSCHYYHRIIVMLNKTVVTIICALMMGVLSSWRTPLHSNSDASCDESDCSESLVIRICLARLRNDLNWSGARDWTGHRRWVTFSSSLSEFYTAISFLLSEPRVLLLHVSDGPTSSAKITQFPMSALSGLVAYWSVQVFGPWSWLWSSCRFPGWNDLTRKTLIWKETLVCVGY